VTPHEGVRTWSLWAIFAWRLTSAQSPRAGTSKNRDSAGKGAYETGKGAHAITSGLEVTWTTTPVKWNHDFFKHLFEYEWELTESPAEAKQWTPKNGAGAATVPHANALPRFRGSQRTPTLAGPCASGGS
jgi:catalase (peroxidase I)